MKTKTQSNGGTFGILRCRGAQIILCILTISATMLASNGNAQSHSVGPRKIGRMASNSSSVNASELQADDASLNYTVNAQAKTLVDTYVEYYPDTCELVSSGSWALATEPSFGKTETGIVTGYLANGDCPDTEFPFAALYYTWTSANPKNPNDNFSATWTSGDPDFPPHTDTYAITLIVPVSYRQAGHAVATADGTLNFKYRWSSTSGNIADLTRCQVGERVTYPGGSPFIWPNPPYRASSPNPTIQWVIATTGVGYDHQYPPTHQAGGGFSQPYVLNVFQATQEYRYQCLFLNTEDFPGWTDVAIIRTVDDPVKGCWVYTISKSGAKASLSPLPGDPKSCNSGTSSSGPIQQSEIKNSSDEIGLSVALRDASVGLNEPLLVDLTVSSRSAEVVGVDLGLNGKANIELTIWEPTGGVVTRTLGLEGFGASGKHSLNPGGTFVEKLLLNEWYEFAQTGTYRIKMTLLNDDLVTSGTAALPQPSTEFSLQIGPHDPTGLEVVSQELADRAIGGERLEERIEAANALSYIRDPLAVDSLVRVLWQGSLVAHYAVDGLRRIGSVEALAALQAATDHPDEDVRATVRSTLETLHNQVQ